MEKSTASEGRKLNMEEKRKLEKLLLADIESKSTVYASNRAHDRKAVEETVLKKAAPKAAALLKNIQRSYEEIARVEGVLRQLGYAVNGYGGERRLAIGYGILPRPLQAFDDETDKTKGALGELRRTYTLKLFAGGEEAKELFASLAKELASIVR